MKKQSITIGILLICISSFSQDITGKWVGTVNSGRKNPTVFIVRINAADGGYTSVIDVPTNRITDLNPRTTTFSNGQLLIDASNLGFKYQGKFSGNGSIINGIFEEGANKFPLSLTQTETEPSRAFNRPQEPVAPFPYIAEEVTFDNKSAGIRLSGTLTLPLSKGPHPVVVLISGSGPQDRDENFATHKPFLVLADFLTKQGLAVLRFDDRGVGKSTGDNIDATTKDFASDVLSAVNYLKSRHEINEKKIGLIGHSEGGIIAPMVANQSKNIAFVVSLAGTGIPGSEISLIQSKTNRGFSVPDEVAYDQAIRKAIAIASADKDVSIIKTELTLHYQDAMAPVLKPLLGSDEKVNEVIAQLVTARTTKWIRYFYTYNPASEIEKLVCPFLSLNGSKDTQVFAKLNQEGIRNALLKGGNKDYLVKELPGLNHMFQECKTGEMAEYRDIEQTFSPLALKEISDWVLSHTRSN
jgi:pimeloyl-ACP methyl ester carboxylesterase